MTALFRDEPDCLVREDLWDVFQVMLSWERCERHSLDDRDSSFITPLQLYLVSGYASINTGFTNLGSRNVPS